MTSWLRVPVKKKKADDNLLSTFFHQTSELEITAEFLAYFNAAIYSSDNSTPLSISDSYSSISPSYPLLQNTFPTVHGISFTDIRSRSDIPLNRKQRDINALISTMPEIALRSLAKDLLTFKGTMQAQIDSLLEQIFLVETSKTSVAPKSSPVPKVVNLGLQIPPGTRNLSAYISAARDYQKSVNASSLSIFVSTDDLTLESLKRSADISWTLYSFPPLPGQSVMTRGPSIRQRQDGYVQKLAEIALLQKSVGFIGTLASSLGQFVYLTRDPTTYFKGVA